MKKVVVMARKLSGEIRIFDGKRWQTHRAEFLVESDTDPEQELWDRKHAREDERDKRADDLAREFMMLESATFNTCSLPTRAAIMHILNQEMPLL